MKLAHYCVGIVIFGMVVAATTIIPAGHRLVFGPDGKGYAVKKTSSRKKYKMPLAQRKKIAAAAKKVKIPVLTVAANAIPIGGAIGETIGAVTQKRPDRLVRAANHLTSAYTGVVLTPKSSTSFDATVSWQPREMMKGLVPNAMVWVAKKFGIFRGANRALGKAKMPIRLA